MEATGEHATTAAAACELSEGAERKEEEDKRGPRGNADAAATIEVSSHHVWSIPW